MHAEHALGAVADLLIQQRLRRLGQAQAPGAPSTRTVDEEAIAFESSQSAMLTADDMANFETEGRPMPSDWPKR